MFCSKKTTNTVVLAQPDHTRSSQHTLHCAVSNCYSRGFTFTRATSALKTDDWDVCIYTITTVTNNFHNHSLKYYQVLQYFSNIIQILCLKLSHTCMKLILSFRNRTESKVFNYYQLKLFPWHQTVVIQRRKLPINFKLETAGWVVCWLHSGGGAPLSLCTRVAEPGETDWD